MWNERQPDTSIAGLYRMSVHVWMWCGVVCVCLENVCACLRVCRFDFYIISKCCATHNWEISISWIKIANERTNTSSFNVQRRAEVLLPGLASHHCATGKSLNSASCSLQQESADAHKDHWVGGWNWALQQDGLNLARQGIRLNDLQPRRAPPPPLLHVFCTLLTYQCICCRWLLSLSVFFGDKGKKKANLSWLPLHFSNPLFIRHQTWGEKSTRVHVCDTDFVKECWESSLTKILCTQRHITKGFTVKTFIAKWSLRTKESREKFTSEWNVRRQPGFPDTSRTRCGNIRSQLWSRQLNSLTTQESSLIFHTDIVHGIWHKTCSE